MTELSLLWPDGMRRTGAAVLDGQTVRDLGLAQTVSLLTQDSFTRQKIGEVLFRLETDAAVIRYRQATIGDLMRHPQLLVRLEALLPSIAALDAYRSSVDRPRKTLHEITWRLGELEQFIEAVEGLAEAFALAEQSGMGLTATSWQALQTRVAAAQQEPIFQRLKRELPDMLERLREHVSVTIGVNLDGQLRPIAATLLSVNKKPFTSSTLLDKLLGGEDAALGPLHTVPRIGTEGVPMTVERSRQGLDPLMVPLFKDLAKVLEKVTKPVAKGLQDYVHVNTAFLSSLHGELAFVIAAVQLVNRLQARGLPLCQPDIAPLEERVCEIKAGFNLNLALLNETADIVTNDVALGERGRIFILTGPNQGGKTTFTQMVGLSQVLAQAGLHVPGEQGRVSPVDAIYTHYPLEEQLAKGTGRFGDEAQRLGEIFQRATRYSLVLLNESLASTSHGESLYLAQDVVRILRRMGTRAIFGTHMHDLAAEAEKLNADTEGDSKVVSLVASRVEEGGQGEGRSYKIVASPPQGRSYAREIARKYGISYEQLEETLRERGIIGDDE